MALFDDLAKEYFRNRKDLNMFDYNKDIEVPAMIEMIGDARNKRLLDLGCGFGEHAELLSKKGFNKLVGLDISSEMIKIAKDKKIPNTEFKVGDMSKPLIYADDTFDIVFSSLSIHYLKEIKSLYSEVNRVLKDHGVFIVSTMHPIRSTMSQSDPMMVGFTEDEGKITVYGDYFTKESTRALVNDQEIKIYAKTFEQMVRTALDTNFLIVDYKDPKPRKESEKYDAEKFKLTTKLPVFMIFKYQKIQDHLKDGKIPDYYDYLMWKTES